LDYTTPFHRDLAFPGFLLLLLEESTPCWKILLQNSCVPGSDVLHHQSTIFINSLINHCFEEKNLGLFYGFNTQLLLFCFCFVSAAVI